MAEDHIQNIEQARSVFVEQFSGISDNHEYYCILYTISHVNVPRQCPVIYVYIAVANTSMEQLHAKINSLLVAALHAQVEKKQQLQQKLNHLKRLRNENGIATCDRSTFHLGFHDCDFVK